MATPSETVTASDPTKRAESVRGWIALLTGLAFVVLATALYGIGRAYRDGYLHQLGLDINQVPEDFYGYLYWGYLGAVELSIGWALRLILAFLVLAVLSFGIRSAAIRFRHLRGALTRWDEFPSPRPIGSYQKYLVLAAITAVFAYIIGITYLVVTDAREKGLSAGRELISNLQSSYGSDRTAVHQWIELTWSGDTWKRTLSGYRLLCTQDLCSIYNPAPDGVGLIVVPLDERPEMRILKKPHTTRPQSSPAASDGNTSQDGSSLPQG